MFPESLQSLDLVLQMGHNMVLYFIKLVQVNTILFQQNEIWFLHILEILHFSDNENQLKWWGCKNLWLPFMINYHCPIWRNVKSFPIAISFLLRHHQRGCSSLKIFPAFFWQIVMFKSVICQFSILRPARRTAETFSEQTSPSDYVLVKIKFLWGMNLYFFKWDNGDYHKGNYKFYNFNLRIGVWKTAFKYIAKWWGGDNYDKLWKTR